MALFSIPVILRPHHLLPVGPFQEWDVSTVRQKPEAYVVLGHSNLHKRGPHAPYPGSRFVLQ